MAIWRKTNKKKERYNLRFEGGLNNFVEDYAIAEGEAVSMKNAASYNPPALISALLSEDITSAIEGAGGDSFPTKSLPSIPNLRIDNVIHFVYADMDVVKMKWGYLELSLSGGVPKFHEIEDLNSLGLLVISNDDYKTSEYGGFTYLAIADMLFKWTGPVLATVGTVTSVGTLPSNWEDMSKCVAFKTKLYAISQKQNVVFFSKSGDPEDFTLAGDAGQFEITTPNEEPLTEIAVVAGKIALFTDHSIHLLYGETASNLSQQQVSSEVGCVSGTLVEMDDARVYFASPNGIVYRWDGYSLPVPISKKLDIELGDKAYQYKNEYCIAKGESPLVYCFNIETFSWFVKNEPSSIENGMVGYIGGFGIGRGSVYDEIVVIETEKVSFDADLVPDTGITQKESINSVEWEYETKRFNFDLISGKTDLLELVLESDYQGIINIELISEEIGAVNILEIDEQVVIYTSPTLIIKGYPIKDHEEIRVYIPPQYHDLNSFKIKLSGKGFANIFGMQLRVRTYDV